MKLTDQQKEHLSFILREFNDLYPPKYTKGAIEHNSFLGDMSSLELAHSLLEEGMDAVAYAITLIDKLQYSED